MAQPIIEIQNVSKEYILTHQLPYVTFRDALTDFVKKPAHLFRGQGKTSQEEFWALRDINLAIQKGEAIGLIGPNGSGKSTLLKILSQITSPSSGEIHLRGRVASLLEVGTGFHPELTGRENIFLNGAILGMTKKEISRKFNDIVAFSGVEKFLDTPVKRYSSGMYVRLAFSVAAHLEPEILMVDEVLAVGDAEFQKKCLGKMDEVSKGAGRTIIFVSHNLEAIKKLCTKCILLKEGRIIMFDETHKVVESYQNLNLQTSSEPLKSRKDRVGGDQIRFTDLAITNHKGKKEIHSGDGLRIVLGYESANQQPIQGARVVVTIFNNDLRPVVRLDSDVTSNTFGTLKPTGQVICVTESIDLIEGRYFVDINFLSSKINPNTDYVAFAGEFAVTTNFGHYQLQRPADKTVNDVLVKYRYWQ